MADKKMKMVKDKDGKMVPEFAAEGKGKMSAGKMVKKKGMAKGMAAGKQVKKKGMAAGGMRKKGFSAGKSVRGVGKATKGFRPVKMVMMTKGGAKGGKRRS